MLAGKKMFDDISDEDEDINVPPRATHADPAAAGEGAAFSSPSMMKRAADANSREQEGKQNKAGKEDYPGEEDEEGQTVPRRVRQSPSVSVSPSVVKGERGAGDNNPAAAVAAAVASAEKAAATPSPAVANGSGAATGPQDVEISVYDQDEPGATDNINNNSNTTGGALSPSPKKVRYQDGVVAGSGAGGQSEPQPQQRKLGRTGSAGRGGFSSGDDSGASGDEEEALEDFDTCEELIGSYIFPRLDTRFAHYEAEVAATRRRAASGPSDDPGESAPLTRKTSSRRGLLLGGPRPASRRQRRLLREAPPNAVERVAATVLSSDVRLSVYFAVVVLILVLVTVLIPLSQIDGPSRACYTFWGYKSNCDARVYDYPTSLFGASTGLCGSTQTRLQAGAAFIIMSLVGYLALALTAGVHIFGLAASPMRRLSLRRRLIVFLPLGVVTLVLQLISWAVIAGVFASPGSCADNSPLAVLPINVSGNRSYGVGFGMNLACWLLHVFALVFLTAIPERVTDLLQSPA